MISVCHVLRRWGRCWHNQYLQSTDNQHGKIATCARKKIELPSESPTFFSQRASPEAVLPQLYAILFVNVCGNVTKKAVLILCRMKPSLLSSGVKSHSFRVITLPPRVKCSICGARVHLYRVSIRLKFTSQSWFFRKDWDFRLCQYSCFAIF